MKKTAPFLLALALVGCKSDRDALGLPSELRHEGYEYYGLANDKPVKIEISYSDMPNKVIGKRTIKLKEIRDGKATFVQTQEESLASEGDITLSLEKDGVYAMASTAGKLKEHSLEMPAKLPVGGGWEDHTELEQTGKKIKLDNKLSIVRKERVSTAAGTFDDALYVTSTGTGTIEGQEVKLETQSWYVRGRGPVKQIIVVSPKSGPSRTITMQVTNESASAASATTPELPAGITPPAPENH